MNIHNDTRIELYRNKPTPGRLQSINDQRWSPDVKVLHSSDKWLSMYGLKKLRLDMSQILPMIGFKHSDAYDYAVKKPISARYSEKLFMKVPYKDGSVYNLIATKDKLSAIELQLKQAMKLYKDRLEWLTSESRHIFGVIEEKNILIVLDVQTSSRNRFHMFIQSLIQTLKEQVMHLSKFNIMRCAVDTERWADELTHVTVEAVDNAMDWLLELRSSVERSATSTLEVMLDALADPDAEAIYLYTEGVASDDSKELILKKAKTSRKPIHVVAMNCDSPSILDYLKTLADITHGRFHAYSMFDADDFGNLDSDTGGGGGVVAVSSGAHLKTGVRPNVMLIWEELDKCRITLEEVQRILEDIKRTKMPTKPVSDAPPSPLHGLKASEPKNELYMSSQQWLSKHGLGAKKLTFYDFLQTLAFKHCDGVVDIKQASQDSREAVADPTLVNARYCSRFAHVQWRDGSLMHVHVSAPIHAQYELKLSCALTSFRKRLEWLHKGSRELFGTILEDKVIILIDTSSSMASRLFLVKDKLQRLLQEQLRNKSKFNIIKFDTKVQAWKEGLQETTQSNLDKAWGWVKMLSVGGSTNTLGALKLALNDPDVNGIYLLTDGRPDQPPSMILTQFQLLQDSIPVHTISFNCSDAEANEFLSQLATDTGGRFHNFSEDGFDVEGPKTYESDDLKYLREEIEQGEADLKRMSELRDECMRLDWFGKNSAKQSSKRGAHTASKRPESAHSSVKPSPPKMRSSRPKSALQLNSSTKRAPSLDERPASAVPATRSYLLRQQNAKSHSVEDFSSRYVSGFHQHDFLMPETQSYLKQAEREQVETSKNARLAQREQAQAVEGKPKKKVKKTKKRSGDKSRIQRWLARHSLASKKLTVLDALAPTMITQTTKYVPIINKHVLSKVFDEVLPLAHTSGSDRSQVQIINPQAVNLPGYEEKLMKQLRKYERKLNVFVWENLSTEERIKYEGEEIPSYLDHKHSMFLDLELSCSEVLLEDVQALEAEIQQGRVYMQQSKDLQITSKRLAKEAKERKQKLAEEFERARRKEMKPVVNEEYRAPADNKNRLLNHRVVARHELDGFYYPGIVTRCNNSRYVEVDFDGGDRQVTSIRYIIATGGAQPCPTIKIGDYVLLKCQVPHEEDDEHTPTTEFCYVPAIVQVTPLRSRAASKCYTVVRFNGKKFTALRNDMLKISRSRFIFACRFIRDAYKSTMKGSSAAVYYSPRKENDEEVGDEEASDDEKGSVASASSKESRKIGESAESSPRNVKVDEDNDDDDVHDDEVDVHDEVDDSKISDVRHQIESLKQQEWARKLEEDHIKKLQELDLQKEQFEVLHRSLIERQSEQARQQDEQARQHEIFLGQQNQLHERQQELIERQLQLQTEKQEMLEADHLRVQQAQLEMTQQQHEQQKNMLKDIFEQQQEETRKHDSERKHERDLFEETHRQMLERQNQLLSVPQKVLKDQEPNADLLTEPSADDERRGKKSKGKGKKAPSSSSSSSSENSGSESSDLKIISPDEAESPSGLGMTAPITPFPLRTGEEVLARFADDGWYYRGTVNSSAPEAGSYYVEDGVGDVDVIKRGDAISDREDANNVIGVGDPVVALHPSFQYAYAPGKVSAVSPEDGALNVTFYDGLEFVVPREESYLLAPSKYGQVCRYILKCEDEMIGQAVVARDDKTGLFNLCSVKRKLAGARNYLIEWPDGNMEVQNYAYLFGSHTKRHEPRTDDHVLAVTHSDSGSTHYIPGLIKSIDEDGLLSLRFCNKASAESVDPTQTFWISKEYYNSAVDFWRTMQEKNESEK